MSLQSQRIWVWLAGLLPVAGLCVLVAKAEVAVRNGPTFRIPITGYDPRDVIHGQYLRYQFQFDWQGDDDCRLVPAWGQQSPSAVGRPLQGGCCLCLTRPARSAFDSSVLEPSVRHIDCDNMELQCDGRLVVNDVTPPLRYFVPEDRAEELERALNGLARPAVEFTLPPSGTPAIKELYLGDQPWRDALQGD